ncbi:hypothetical protein PV328_000053 [Microctonus aethiopoides]|uniref:Nuclear respiratory factor 1 NLS/DNA-binding dimerisation domain-containing protein n=1 Tax=Microctonus aethiopoides TaxID=144406 RepID=A0AA39KW17_9HYME|nr:hypothetical protein PV328_000053 [Microctonus aethiopoides]
MRYSTIQDDKYGIGLGQQSIPNNNVDDSMMAATGEVEPVGESNVNDSSMIYNLPLLFANGYPTSLETISLPQLEKFITFMVQCSVNHDRVQLISKPLWWPKEVEFSIPFVRPKILGDNWMGNLKKLVFQCYTYHKSEYLLRFCSYLAQYPREKIYYVNNWDLTTSLYHKNTGKLLATFRNENMDYDKVVESPRRSLLSHNNTNSNSTIKNKKAQQRKECTSSSSLVVLQPQMEEIYLCDNCDAEFGDLEKMKNHERMCTASMNICETSRTNTPCEMIVEDEPELSQNQFMDYFNLYTGNEPPKKKSLELPMTITCDFEPRRSSRRMRTSVNFVRCPTIPFSSPAGIAMSKKTKPMSEELQQERVDRMERYMSAPPLNKFNRPKWLDRVPQFNRWVVTYKSNKENLPLDNHVHQYTFDIIKHKPVLSIKSQLLYAACGRTIVRLERLTDVQLEDLKYHPWKYRRPIRQRSSHYRLRPQAMIPKTPTLYLEDQPSTNSTNSLSTVDENNLSSNLENGEIANFRSRPMQRLTQTQPAESKTIILVDLCSSDDEDDKHNEDSVRNPVLPDENCDPLYVSGNSTRTTYLKNLTLQTNQFLSNGLLLSKTNDKCNNNRRINNGVLDTCKPFSPIFKPTP